MAKKSLFVGMLAMALTFGFAFTSCSNDSNDDDEFNGYRLKITGITTQAA